MRMTKDEVIVKYGLCAVCADRESCEDMPNDMVLSCCSSFEDDGGKEYEVSE